MSEHTPILAERTETTSTMNLLSRNSLYSPSALLAQASILIFFLQLWGILLRQDPIFNLFSTHPIFNSLAVIGFAEGILLLQPTKTAGDKKKGLAIHQIFQLSASVLIIVGTLAIIYNKISHGAKNFQSWHGTVGIITFGLIFVQILAGAIFVWSPLTGLVGGDLKAKSLWKYHRMGGYLTLTGLVVTPMLAVQSDWLVGHSTLMERYILTGALSGAAVAFAFRINFSKWGLKTSRA